MLWNWTGFGTNWFKMGRSDWRHMQPALRQDSDSTFRGSQMTGSGEAFWSRFTGIFQSGRLRSLTEELRLERESRVSLEASLAAARSELERTHEMLAESLRNERLVYQMQVNVNMQSKFGMVPFPQAPAIPDDIYNRDTPAQIQPDYVTARSLQAEAISKFSERAREMRERLAAG